MNVGDIVKLAHHAGDFWIAHARDVASVPPARLWRFIARGGQSITASVRDALFVARPTFPVGVELNYQDRRITVLRDNEDGTVRIRLPRERVPIDGGYHVDAGIGESDVGKADLVAENLHRFID